MDYLYYFESEDDHVSASIFKRRDEFQTHASDMREYEGMGFKILEPLTTNEADIAEVGPMFRIEFDNGDEVEAFSDEVFGKVSSQEIGERSSGDERLEQIIDSLEEKRVEARDFDEYIRASTLGEVQELIREFKGE